MTACTDIEDVPAAPDSPSKGVRRVGSRVLVFVRSWGRRTLWVLLALAVIVVVTSLRLKSNLHDALGPLGPRLSNAGMLDHLLNLPNPVSGDPRVLVLNGQHLLFDTRVSDESMDQVLDESLENCPTRQELGGPVGSDGRGYTVCIHPNPTAHGAPSLSSRIRTFGATLDMASFGTFEYVYAEQHGARTALIRMRSTEDLDVQALVPIDGDAPGVDLADFPRPPAGRRVLQAYEEGQPYRLTIFSRSEQTVAQLQHWYRQHVNTETWHEADVDAVARERHMALERGHGLIFWRKEDPTRFTLVSFDALPAKGETPAGTTVAIAEAL